MKKLVIFYSRTGNTRNVAERIAQSLGADLVELKERTGRCGVWGFIKGGYDAFRHIPTKLVPVDDDLSSYDLVIIGSPVWAGTLCPAVRTFLQQAGATVPRTAFFCTHGGGGASRSCPDVEKLIGKPLAATLVLRDKEVKRGGFVKDLDAFLESL